MEQIKNKRFSIVAFLLMIIIVLHENFFGFLNVPFSEINYLLLICVIAAGCIVSSNFHLNFHFKEYFFLKFILVYSIILLLEIFDCKIVFQQPFINTLGSAYWKIPILAVVPLSICVLNEKNYEKLKSNIVFLGACASLISIIAYYLKGSLFGVTVSSGYRDGELFVFISSMLILASTIFAAENVFEKKYRYAWIVLINLFCYIQVMRFRGQMIGILCALAVTYLIGTNAQKWIKISVIFLCILMIGVNTSFTSQINLLYFQIINRSGTASVRFNEIQYFTRQFLTHPIMGFGGGLLKSGYHENFTYAYNYYTSDVGIWGWLYNYGLTGVVFYIWFLIKLLKRSFSNKSKVKNYGAMIYSIYLVSVSMTMIYFDYPTDLIINSFIYCLIDRKQTNTIDSEKQIVCK